MKDEVRAKLAAASDGSASVQVSSNQSMVTDFLSSDVEIKGSIKFRNQLLIEGKVEGEIISDGVLTIGENAEIRGEIKAKSIIIFGNVHGNIAAAERCELKSKCILQGNLKAARLLMEEGGYFRRVIRSHQRIRPEIERFVQAQVARLDMIMNMMR